MTDHNREIPPPASAGPPASAPPPPVSDPWTERLKEKMLKDRNRQRRNLSIVVVVLVLLLGGALWLMYPGVPLPLLSAVAFDGVCRPGEQAQVRLQLEPRDGEQPFPRDLAGLHVDFLDVVRPGPPLAKVLTGKAGQAWASVHFAASAVEAKFEGRLVGNRETKTSMDQAKIFFIPADSPLVIADIQELLADPALDLETKELSQIQAHEPTVKLLRSLQGSKKQIIYLAIKSETAQGYQRARRWLGIKGQIFPPGPVLGRPTYHDKKTAEDAHRQIIADLVRNWKLSAVTRRPESAAFYREMHVLCIEDK